MRSRVAALLAALLLAGNPSLLRAAEETPKAKLAAIEAAQAAAQDRRGEEYQQAGQSDALREEVIARYMKKLEKNVEEAIELARDNPGDATAFEALKFAIRTNRGGPGDGSARALRMILERDDDRRPSQGNYLGYVALTMFQYPEAETLLRRVLERNPSRDDRAAACYWLARYLSHQAQMVRRLRRKPEEKKLYERYSAAEPIGKFLEEKNPDTLDKAAEILFARSMTEFGDVRLPGDTQTIAEFVSGELFAMRNLGIGKAAPEIEGRDHEGKSFKLSEMRGKVTVLTFSGNWCGACVGMYPQERSLLARYKDRPYAMVSVSTDQEIGTLKKAIASGEITWRCWWDGGKAGPITTKWGITGFPSIFVLDRQGVIRFKDVRGDDLDRAVAELLDETEKL